MDDESDSLTAAWIRTQAQLPPGWKLDSLRCASTSLAVADRSEDWIAVAIGPDGTARTHRAPDPIAALAGVAADLAST
jgi:hypothetical protein